jgi:hypothetical protein
MPRPLLHTRYGQLDELREFHVYEATEARHVYQ